MKKLIILILFFTLLCGNCYAAQTTVNTSTDTFGVAWDRQQDMNTEIYESIALVQKMDAVDFDYSQENFFGSYIPGPVGGEDYANVGVGIEVLDAMVTAGYAIGTCDTDGSTGDLTNVTFTVGDWPAVGGYVTVAVGFSEYGPFAISAIDEVAKTITITGATPISSETAAGIATTSHNIAAFGGKAFHSLVGGADDVAVGFNAGYHLTTGKYNVFSGTSTGYYLTTGDHNCLVGHHAGMNAIGGKDYLTALGSSALVGRSYASGGLTSGGHTAIGAAALAALSTATTPCTAVGRYALTADTSGGSNTAIGYKGLNTIAAGGLNTACGYKAGSGDGSNTYSARQDCDGLTFLGAHTGLTSSAAYKSYITVIGCGASGGVNNTINLGRNVDRVVIIGLDTLTTYADNAAAISGGLTAGMLYRTSTGVLMVVFTP